MLDHLAHEHNALGLVKLLCRLIALDGEKTAVHAVLLAIFARLAQTALDSLMASSFGLSFFSCQFDWLHL
jgi:hypothetical protein